MKCFTIAPMKFKISHWGLRIIFFEWDLDKCWAKSLPHPYSSWEPNLPQPFSSWKPDASDGCQKKMFPNYPYKKGISNKLQVAIMKFNKLLEPKVAKLKGGHSSNVSLVFQSWLKDIWMYAMEYCLSQLEAIQLIKDYTARHKWKEVEFILFTRRWTVLQGLNDHLSLVFQSCKTVSSLINTLFNCLQNPRIQRLALQMNYRFWWVKSLLVSCSLWRKPIRPSYIDMYTIYMTPTLGQLYGDSI